MFIISKFNIIVIKKWNNFFIGYDVTQDAIFKTINLLLPLYFQIARN